MKQKVELRRAKLPPILEIDEDGIPVSGMEVSWQRPRWSADGEMPNVQMGDWPTEFDD
jgi:hypothetical protein